MLIAAEEMPTIQVHWVVPMAPGHQYGVVGVIETKKSGIGKIGGGCLTFPTH